MIALYILLAVLGLEAARVFAEPPAATLIQWMIVVLLAAVVAVDTIRFLRR